MPRLGQIYCCGMPLELTSSMTFRFMPPATPEIAAAPCPHCGAHDVKALYETARTRYYRCLQCGQVRTECTREQHDPEPAAAA